MDVIANGLIRRNNLKQNQQGGLCLVLGSPGTGKTVIKEAIKQDADKRTIVEPVAK